jgi:EF hand
MDATKLWRTIATGILACAVGAGFAYAKLPQPPMDDAAKAKAKEAKDKDIDAAKKDAEQLAKAQDRIAERYKKEMKLKGAGVQPVVEKFALLDVDKDGCIDRKEAESVPELMADFRPLDANHDNRLCSSELREWATKQRTATTAARKK